MKPKHPITRLNKSNLRPVQMNSRLFVNRRNYTLERIRSMKGPENAKTRHLNYRIISEHTLDALKRKSFWGDQVKGRKDHQRNPRAGAVLSRRLKFVRDFRGAMGTMIEFGDLEMTREMIESTNRMIGYIENEFRPKNLQSPKRGYAKGVGRLKIPADNRAVRAKLETIKQELEIIEQKRRKEIEENRRIRELLKKERGKL